jgi:integrase
MASKEIVSLPPAEASKTIKEAADELSYVHEATSNNTRNAYRNDVRQFIAWGGVLPTTPDVLLQYLQAFAKFLNPRTLRRRLVALKNWHFFQGFPDPTGHPLIKKTISGILRVHGKPLEKASVLSVEQLVLIVDYLSTKGKLVNYRDNALLQMGFFGAFRRSELVAIHWEHITFVPEGMEILIPRSKTDQKAEGQVCAIPYGNKMLCPVTALLQWREKSGLLAGPVFRAVSQKGNISKKALLPASINYILKILAFECKLPNPEKYSGHSLRRGFATSASKKGATLCAIMRQGRWKHERTVNGYIQEGQLFEANAASLVLEQLSPSFSLNQLSPET